MTARSRVPYLLADPNGEPHLVAVLPSGVPGIYVGLAPHTCDGLDHEHCDDYCADPCETHEARDDQACPRGRRQVQLYARCGLRLGGVSMSSIGRARACAVELAALGLAVPWTEPDWWVAGGAVAALAEADRHRLRAVTYRAAGWTYAAAHHEAKANPRPLPATPCAGEAAQASEVGA